MAPEHFVFLDETGTATNMARLTLPPGVPPV
jgi:hypothetical protein